MAMVCNKPVNFAVRARALLKNVSYAYLTTHLSVCTSLALFPPRCRLLLIAQKHIFRGAEKKESQPGRLALHDSGKPMIGEQTYRIYVIKRPCRFAVGVLTSWTALSVGYAYGEWQVHSIR